MNYIFALPRNEHLFTVLQEPREQTRLLYQQDNSLNAMSTWLAFDRHLEVEQLLFSVRTFLTNGRSHEQGFPTNWHHRGPRGRF